MAPTQADPSALLPDDAVRLAELVAEVLAAPAPGQALSDALVALEPLQKPALSAALYEALCYRVGDLDYWAHCKLLKAYRLLGPAREDAAFFHAATAAQMQPDWSGSDHAFGFMFRVLMRRGRERDALDLFRHQMQYRPEVPCARSIEIAPLILRLEPASPDMATAPSTPRPEACRLHRVVEQEEGPPLSFPVFGGEVPYALAPLAHGVSREAIAVAEFADAEVLIDRGSVVVLDRFGDVHEASSVGEFPERIRAAFEREAAAGQCYPQHEVDEAVIICDRISGANLCHAVLDQITRLALYQRLGVDTGRVLVIAPEPHMPAQREILRRAGVTAHIGTERAVRVRARRLWVSSNCREVRHTAHFGAGWAVRFAQQTLGGQGVKGWRRLYLSRGDAAIRQVSNEAEVIALLDAHGFEPIMPGRMSYDAQLAAFRQASHVIAPHGAGLTHILLCPLGTHVLEIFHPLYGTADYARLAAASGISYAAMLARDWESDAPHWNDPALVDVNAGGFATRHMRVEPAVLAAYLATLD